MDKKLLITSTIAVIMAGSSAFAEDAGRAEHRMKSPLVKKEAIKTVQPEAAEKAVEGNKINPVGFDSGKIGGDKVSSPAMKGKEIGGKTNAGAAKSNVPGISGGNPTDGDGPKGPSVGGSSSGGEGGSSSGGSNDSFTSGGPKGGGSSSSSGDGWGGSSGGWGGSSSGGEGGSSSSGGDSSGSSSSGGSNDSFTSGGPKGGGSSSGGDGGSSSSSGGDDSSSSSSSGGDDDSGGSSSGGDDKVSSKMKKGDEVMNKGFNSSTKAKAGIGMKNGISGGMVHEKTGIGAKAKAGN